MALPKPLPATGFGLLGMTWRPVVTPDEQAFASMRAAIANGATIWSSSSIYGMAPEELTAGLALLRWYFEKYPEDGRQGHTFHPDLLRWQNSHAALPSEPSIRRAYAVCPISVVEIEFSLWSTEMLTNGVAATCKELSIPIFTYAPLGYGFLTGQNFPKNLELVNKVNKFAMPKGATPAQLALSWIRAYSNTAGCGAIIPIPGATAAQRVEENCKVVLLSAEEKEQLDNILRLFDVQGERQIPAMDSILWT